MKIFFVLMLFFLGAATPLKAGGLEDYHEATMYLIEMEFFYETPNREEADWLIMLYSRAIESGELSYHQLSDAYYSRGWIFETQEMRESAISDYRRVVARGPVPFSDKPDTWDPYKSVLKDMERLGVSP